MDCLLNGLNILWFLHDTGFDCHVIVNGPPEIDLAVKLTVLELSDALLLHSDFSLLNLLR